MLSKLFFHDFGEKKSFNSQTIWKKNLNFNIVLFSERIYVNVGSALHNATDTINFNSMGGVFNSIEGVHLEGRRTTGLVSGKEGFTQNQVHLILLL